MAIRGIRYNLASPALRTAWAEYKRQFVPTAKHKHINSLLFAAGWNAARFSGLNVPYAEAVAEYQLSPYCQVRQFPRKDFRQGWQRYNFYHATQHKS